MRQTAVHTYVASVAVLAAGALFLVQWQPLTDLTTGSTAGLLALIALAFVSESLALSITYEKEAGHSSIIFIPILACQILFGTAATVLLVLSAYLAAEAFLRNKEAIRAAFNVSQLIVAVVLAGLTFSALGGRPLGLGQTGETPFLSQLIPFFSFAGVFLGSNHLAVSFVIALDQKKSFLEVWKNRAGRSAANSLYDLLISPVALAVAFLYLELGFIGILFSILPILFIRHAYLNTYKLQEANRDLLKALVKAIETRDPYTSGHSMRVSRLACDIARRMGLGRKRVDAIEAGALLHDIGKIDSIYTEILRKPDSLTDHEREIIESHVEKGAELLSSLSSFGKDVIASVRHHHERVDGNGYPDGLEGKEIPIGARIIKVCDAIDAMLSDRPYRDALDLTAVREQLTIYKGEQFDAEIVNIVSQSDILEAHEKRMVELRDKGEEPELTSFGSKRRIATNL